MTSSDPIDVWPALHYEDWQDTCSTLHLWTQVVGKIRLAQTPWVNHSWHVALYVTPRGLTTSPIPYDARTFELGFDFIDHRLTIATSDGAVAEVALEPKPVRTFYEEVLRALAGLGLAVSIDDMPCEIAEPIRFGEDTTHASYDRQSVGRFRRVLTQVDRVFKEFRSGFVGKVSPVHFFWGSFDLAVTRFSGRAAPRHPGGIPHMPDRVAQEAYSHEVSSAGFWPGMDGVDAVFYSYAYPEPPGFRSAAVRPEQVTFESTLGEFLLPYEVVRTAADPDAMLLEFLESTYAAAANAAKWDRAALECRRGVPGVPRAI